MLCVICAYVICDKWRLSWVSYKTCMLSAIMLSVIYTECHLCWVSFLLSVSKRPVCWVPLCWMSFMKVSYVLVSNVKSVICTKCRKKTCMLNVIMLNVIMLSVVTPRKQAKFISSVFLWLPHFWSNDILLRKKFAPTYILFEDMFSGHTHPRVICSCFKCDQSHYNHFYEFWSHCCAAVVKLLYPTNRSQLNIHGHF